MTPSSPATLLLDTSSLAYRAFFSIPASVTDGEGRPVNAVRGYLDMVGRLVASRRPARVVHVYDGDWRPAPRVAAYAGYKADRPPEPDGLTPQFELLREVLDAAGASQAVSPEWEAEDAIGALAAGAAPGERVEIVTGDRDLIQLVRDPVVAVLFTVRGVTDLRVLDEAEVRRRYGVPPERYADFATLRGDPSDGLPGVRGVGEKTARDLVLAYADLDALVEAAARGVPSPGLRTPALRSAIRDAAPYLRAMREVVPIRTTVPLEEWAPDPSPARLAELAERRGLSGPVRRFREALGV